MKTLAEAISACVDWIEEDGLVVIHTVRRRQDRLWFDGRFWCLETGCVSVFRVA